MNPRVGGPSIRPPTNTRATQVSRNPDWVVSPGAEKYRRGMYILFRRAVPYAMLTMFDSPDSTVACARRDRSNSPLQSLTLLNDPVFFECAQSLGAAFSRESSETSGDWISRMFEQTLSRSPTPAEVERLHRLYQEQLSLLQEVDKQSLHELAPAESQMDITEAAARILLARSLLNLDEFITRE